jgi:hypothetical protein
MRHVLRVSPSARDDTGKFKACLFSVKVGLKFGTFGINRGLEIHDDINTNVQECKPAIV